MNEELEFLRWFYYNCDFGPAHEDVILSYHEEYEKETGNRIPDGYRFEEENL